MAAAYSWIAVGAIVFAGLLTAAYYVATVPFAASTDWPTLVGQQADAAHLSRFSEVLGWLRREKDELAGGEGLPRTEQVEEALRETAPTRQPSPALAGPVRWRLP